MFICLERRKAAMAIKYSVNMCHASLCDDASGWSSFPLGGPLIAGAINRIDDRKLSVLPKRHYALPV